MGMRRNELGRRDRRRLGDLMLCCPKQHQLAQFLGLVGGPVNPGLPQKNGRAQILLDDEPRGKSHAQANDLAACTMFPGQRGDVAIPYCGAIRPYDRYGRRGEARPAAVKRVSNTSHNEQWAAAG